MADLDALKLEARKLNAKATQAKMDLHDLSEELPTACSKICPKKCYTHGAVEL